MIKHNLQIYYAGHEPRPELEDFEVVHVLYRLETMNVEGSNTVTEYSSSGARVVYLDPWDVENRIPGAEVNKDIMRQWVEDKIDLEALKLENISNLQPVQPPQPK
jgi:hypothetical protein